LNDRSAERVVSFVVGDESGFLICKWRPHRGEISSQLTLRCAYRAQVCATNEEECLRARFQRESCNSH
jgi:hypothetical protein